MKTMNLDQIVNVLEKNRDGISITVKKETSGTFTAVLEFYRDLVVFKKFTRGGFKTEREAEVAGVQGAGQMVEELAKMKIITGSPEMLRLEPNSSAGVH